MRQKIEYNEDIREIIGDNITKSYRLRDSITKSYRLREENQEE